MGQDSCSLTQCQVFLLLLSASESSILSRSRSSFDLHGHLSAQVLKTSESSHDELPLEVKHEAIPVNFFEDCSFDISTFRDPFTINDGVGPFTRDNDSINLDCSRQNCCTTSLLWRIWLAAIPTKVEVVLYLSPTSWISDASF